MANPLRFVDLFGISHVEPSVSGLVEVETVEPTRPILFNDLILVSPFRSGKPLTLTTFSSMSALADRHDPDNNGDQGVALARISKAPFGDPDVFGAGDIITCRLNAATPASAFLDAGVTHLVQITTGDYGSHTNRSRKKVSAGTQYGKKILLHDDNPARTFIGDNLGVLLNIQYVGNGSAATLDIIYGGGQIGYTGQPVDGDKITINTGVAGANPVVFEFDSGGGVTGSDVAVTIGVDANATFANLASAIQQHIDGVLVTPDPDNSRLALAAPEAGLILTETLDSGGHFTVTQFPPAARLRTTLTAATDGSVNLDIPLGSASFKAIDRLAIYISNQLGYTCSVLKTANKFLPSSALDVLSGFNIKTAGTLTGYVAAIVDWINTSTRGNYTAVELARGEPQEDDGEVAFSGGTSPAVGSQDLQNALDVIGAEIELGGILLIDSDDPSDMAMVGEFIDEQFAAGKWFRAFFGAQPGLTTDQYLTIAGALDNIRMRLAVQRVGVFGDDGAIDYLHPSFLAAMLAGGCAGNKPYVNPLTNKELRVAGIHEDDSFDLDTRVSLLEGGITVIKKELDTIRISLSVTTSRDPDKRMNRIMSERDTVDLIGANMRQAFLPFRGQWAGSNMAARVFGVGGQVLEFFASPAEGALTSGVDDSGNAVGPWRWLDPPFVLSAGLLSLNYQGFIGGELDHISLHGRMEYQRIVGQLSGSGQETFSTVVPTS